MADEVPVVTHAVLEQRWETLTFVHWAYHVTDVQRLVPRGLTVEEHDGVAWVGLVPFRMQVGPPRVPALPWLGRFCETNVRTYVRDRAGRSGVWFFSLDASRLAAVAAGRALGLPYCWGQLSVHAEGDRVTYAARRYAPGRAVRSHLEVRVGEPVEPDARDRFLTARFRLYSGLAGRLVQLEVEHAPWELHHAELLACQDELVTAAGLPRPTGEPLVRFSRGLDVRAGMPRPVGD